MMVSIRNLVRAGRDQFLADLRTDPWLRYILLLALFLSAFWFWHRIPNFATRDEFSRILDALVPYAKLLEEPTLGSLRDGVVWGRAPFGATTYLYGILFLPVVVVAVLLGHGEAFSAIATPGWEFGFYAAWSGTPEWVWTWTIAIVRLTNVVFALGSVYLTYRLGSEVANRAAGRLASLLLTLTFGFLTIAHEGGEDMPATFFVLLTVLLLIYYIRSRTRAHFLAASAAGGLAIGFKLTAAPVVALIGIGYGIAVLRAESDSIWDAIDSRLVGAGALVGLLVILFSFPTTVVGRLDLVAGRLLGDSVQRATHMTGPAAPSLWWFLRGYFTAFGLPLFGAAFAGVLSSLWRLRERPPAWPAATLVAVSLISYILLFWTWHDFRVHHLLPTFPLVAVLLGWSLVRWRDRFPAVGRAAIVFVVLVAALYAGIGVAGYADMPRDNATAYLETNAEDADVVEVYRLNLQDTAVPHGMNVTHAFGAHGTDETLDPCPRYIQLGYRDLLYMAEGTYLRGGPVRANYIRKVVDGEFGYEIVAEFGPRPPNFVPERPTPGNYTDLLRRGVVPQTEQYADEQELRENQYTVILELTGACDRSRYPPF